MGSKLGGNMNYKRLFSLLGIGALLFAIRAAPWGNVAAADDPPKPVQAKVAAEALPAPGTYWIDPDHSFAYFGASHHIVGLVRGRFDKVAGTINVSRDPAECSVNVLIDASTISTQVPQRDDDLRGPAYFDVKKFPTMTYQGRGIRRASENTWTMDGALTIHGVTKEVPLTFTFNGAFSPVQSGQPVRVAFHGVAATKRADFGMGARDKGEVPTSGAPDVAIEIDVEADSNSTQ
jgi:polyisoprenoid-binding protein YceI